MIKEYFTPISWGLNNTSVSMNHFVRMPLCMFSDCPPYTCQHSLLKQIYSYNKYTSNTCIKINPIVYLIWTYYIFLHYWSSVSNLAVCLLPYLSIDLLLWTLVFFLAKKGRNLFFLVNTVVYFSSFPRFFGLSLF